MVVEQHQIEAQKEAHQQRYLTFFIAEQLYGVAISDVHEVIGVQHVTPIPRSVEGLKGVINLRGNIVSLMDLRVRLGIEPTDDTAETCIVIVMVEYNGSETKVGVVVDRVWEVTDIDTDSISRDENWTVSEDQEVVSGIARLESGMVLLIDLEAAVASDAGVAAPPVTE